MGSASPGCGRTGGGLGPLALAAPAWADWAVCDAKCVWYSRRAECARGAVERHRPEGLSAPEGALGDGGKA
jgi:hypothetical protein